MEYNLKVDERDMQIMFQGLGELPLKVAAGLFAKISTQKAEQDKPQGMPNAGTANSNQ